MIAIATSTRADWGLLTPLAATLAAGGADIRILASNMHLMPEMGMTVEEIEAAGYAPVRLATAGVDPTATFADTALAYGRWFADHRPRCVVILGDRYEMLAVASAAMLNAVPVVHIAGGTVSEGAIDNAVRNAITQLSSLHLAETELCARRLLAMGIAEDRVVVTGALGVWNALNVPLLTADQLWESLGKRLPDKFFVATLHAATLADVTPSRQMEEFLAGLDSFFVERDDFGVILTYPNNDTDPAPLIARLKEFAALHEARTVLVPSLGMRRYLSAVSLSQGVVGNSSSGVVEVASLGVPTLDIGIRQQGRERAASVFHCGWTRSEILEGLRRITSLEARAIAATRSNPYARPDTPRLMAAAIEISFCIQNSTFKIQH